MIDWVEDELNNQINKLLTELIEKEMGNLKEIFKIEDRVFHYVNGWGNIIEIVFEDGYKLIKVDFDNRVCNSFTHEHIKLLSFTEYTLQGFSLERPIELPEVGELCLVSQAEDSKWAVRKFIRYDKKFICLSGHGNNEIEWEYMKRIKILD